MNEIIIIIYIVLMIILVLSFGGVITYLVIQIVKVSKKDKEDSLNHIKERIGKKVDQYSQVDKQYYSVDNLDMNNDTMRLDRDIEERPVISYKQQKYQIVGSRFTVGRSDKNDIVIKNNRYVSKTHFVIMERSDGYYLRDMSTNGSKLNGELLIRNERKLRNNDCIEVIGDKFYFFDKQQSDN